MSAVKRNDSIDGSDCFKMQYRNARHMLTHSARSTAQNHNIKLQDNEILKNELSDNCWDCCSWYNKSQNLILLISIRCPSNTPHGQDLQVTLV